MRVLGVDLAWGQGYGGRKANESGLVAVDPDGTIRNAGWKRDPEDIIKWIEYYAKDDTLLLLDAPLVVSNATGQRPCETQVGQRYGRWKVSANSTNLNSPNRAGQVLLKALCSTGWRYDDGSNGPPKSGRVVSEVYPYTTIVGASELGYNIERPVYERKPKHFIGNFKVHRANQCDDLVRRLKGLDKSVTPILMDSDPATRELVTKSAVELSKKAYKHREDLIDAVLCAWTALLWLQFGFERCQILGTAGETIIAAARPEQRRAQP